MDYIRNTLGVNVNYQVLDKVNPMPTYSTLSLLKKEQLWLIGIFLIMDRIVINKIICK